MSKAYDNEEGIALTSVKDDPDALEYNDDGLDDNTGTNAHKQEPVSRTVIEEGLLTKCLSPFVNVIVFFQYYWIYNRLVVVLGAAATVLILLLVTGIVEHLEGPKTSRNGLFAKHHDSLDVPYWTTLQSSLDCKRDMIDHWCLDGSNSNCKCADPLIPEGKIKNDDWVRASKTNRKQVKKAIKEKYGMKYSHIEEEEADEKNHTFAEEGKESSFRTVDVVFLGDSLTEQRAGRKMGKDSDDLKGIKHEFEKKFLSEDSDYVGMALGIAGDTTTNLLWRIVKGKEVQMDMDPKVFWVTIGINDLMNTMCSEEVTLLGIINIVEELRLRKPNSFVVINSLLPVNTGKDILMSFDKVYGPWRSLSNINKVLHQFAQKTKRVKYFDANTVFTETRDDGNLYVRNDLYTDLVHPTKKGQKLWMNAQIDFLHELIHPSRKETKNENDSYYPYNGDFDFTFGFDDMT